MSWTKKEDVKIVLYDDGYEYRDYPISILISNKDYESSHRIEYNELMFANELDELDIQFESDEWISYKYTDRDKLKTELERRGFLVVMGEYY